MLDPGAGAGAETGTKTIGAPAPAALLGVGKRAARAPRSGVKPTNLRSPDEILGTDENRTHYWRTVRAFGTRKNPKPRTTSVLFVAVVENGTDPAPISQAAERYRASESDPKFMVGLAGWLEGDGYLNPDTEALAPGGSTELLDFARSLEAAP